MVWGPRRHWRGPQIILEDSGEILSPDFESSGFEFPVGWAEKEISEMALEISEHVPHRDRMDLSPLRTSTIRL